MEKEPKGFYKLKVLPRLIKNMKKKLNITKPTKVQKNCIIPCLEGKDVIGIAKTGSGKTLAFAIPIVQYLEEIKFGICAVVLTVSTELACQIARTFEKLSCDEFISINVFADCNVLLKDSIGLARRPCIVIATPSRLANLITGNSNYFKRLKFLVLDEADRLLSGSYDYEMTTIFEEIPKERQNFMFSATLSNTMITLMKMYNKNHITWIDENPVKTVRTLEQFYVLCPQNVKECYLIALLNVFFAKMGKSGVIIFVTDFEERKFLLRLLEATGFDVVDLCQKGKCGAVGLIRHFNSGVSQKNIILASDMFSRGLHIPSIKLVVNYGVPFKPESYLHRVGRTARVGEKGYAVTMVTSNEIFKLKKIEKFVNYKFNEFPIDEKEVAKLVNKTTQVKSLARVSANNELKEQYLYEKYAKMSAKLHNQHKMKKSMEDE